MTVEQQEVWGAPAPKPPTWSTRTTLAAVGIAAVLAVAGGLVVHAASGGTPDAGPGHMGAPPGGPGDFRTELTQTGSITAASDTSLTVRSDDGYSHTYLLDTETRRPRQPLQSGQHVTVRATEANGATDATAVLPAR